MGKGIKGWCEKGLRRALRKKGTAKGELIYSRYDWGLYLYVIGGEKTYWVWPPAGPPRLKKSLSDGMRFMESLYQEKLKW